MFIPVKISSASDINFRLSIPTGFDYDIEWKKDPKAVVYLDDKKILLPRDDDKSILNLTYKKCSKYFLSSTGMEFRVKSYDIKYPEHIAAAIIIKETARKFNYSDEWAVGVFENIFSGEVFDDASSYIYAILKENEGGFFFNELENSLQFAQLLPDQGRMVLRIDQSFEIKNRGIEKEKLLEILNKNHKINWIRFIHDLHIITNLPSLNDFMEELRANELTTLVIPATDGWNNLIITYFYQHKSKRMQDIIEMLYQKHLRTPAVFIS